MAIPELDARIVRGISLLTAHLGRDPDTGAFDWESFRAVLGFPVTDDDVIGALSDMIIAAELVMLTYQVKTNVRPIEVLREIAVYRQGKREGTAGE